LDQKEGLAFKHSTFCECLGFAAEACCYASAFGFKSLVSIEISEESQKLGYIYLKLIDERAARSFQSSVSRFQERIAVDAEVSAYIMPFNTHYTRSSMCSRLGVSGR
jgi:hypothetical protein